MAKNLSPKYSNLALKYDVIVPRTTRRTKVPNINKEVLLVYSRSILLLIESLLKFPSIKKYIRSASMGKAILSPIKGAK